MIRVICGSEVGLSQELDEFSKQAKTNLRSSLPAIAHWQGILPNIPAGRRYQSSFMAEWLDG